MTCDEVQLGMIVRLRSGGPWMTVESAGATSVSCVWFNDMELRREVFSTETLDEDTDAECL